jgi:hemoglobin-like flavoprotein/Ran GTPase-activating protein (RanGAP) involved in mRNA processing and transport
MSDPSLSEGSAAAPDTDQDGGDARIGQLVAGQQYRVLRRIGAGGFGIVYEVETTVGALRRALKVLDARWVKDDEARARFINEALVLEEVHHPNVARCYAAGQLEDGSPYLLFELIEGVELGSLETPLDPQRAVRLAKQIAAGIRAAHENGVLHRDLKPENILVLDAGTPREQVRVVDFGIAKLTDAGSTSTRTIVGTPEFMAPEQFLPGSVLDFRVDLWQLGATLFCMLTGRPPYRGSRPGHLAAIAAQQQQYEDAGPAPSDVREALRKHPALDDLVRRLLASDPDRRPGSAAEVCEELARIEHALAPGAGKSGSEALLGALCATPSQTSWIALHGYLGAQGERTGGLVALASRLLGTWPDELRGAPCILWEASKRGTPHALWPLTRALDLSGRGLSDEDATALAANPALETLTRLDLSHNEIGNAGLAALAASPHLRSLVHLDLSHNRITSVGVEALCTGGSLGRVRSLRLAHNGIGARGAEALAGSALQLVELDLSGNDIGPGGAAALAAAPMGAALRVLALDQNGIGPDGVAALAVSQHLRCLRILRLTHNRIGPSGAAALALSEIVRTIEALHLAQNGLGREGLQLLLGSTALGSLEELDLSSNGLTPSGAMVLAGSPFARRLKRLTLSDDALGDAGIAALLGSPHLSGIRELTLSQNGITASGATLLADAPPQLECLDLSHNPLGDAGAEAAAAALARLRVTRLALTGCNIGADGLERLLATERLTGLDVSSSPLGRRGIEAIARARGLGLLEHLSLSQGELGPEGTTALMASPHLGALRSLDLSSNGIGDVGVTAIVASAPRLSRLERLHLADNGLGPDAAEALSASSLANHLCHLDLAHNQLGDAGAEMLARGSGWHSLRQLSLRANAISLGGAAAMTTSGQLSTVESLDLADNALSNLVDVHSLSKRTVDLMESSFARISASGADVAERFYAELFQRFPAVKPLFAKTTIARQQRHLMASLTLVIDNLRNPDAVEKALLELGRRHVGYQVVPTHYYAVTSTLLDTLAATLGADWTDELEEAWHEGLQAVAAVMLRAADRSAQRTEANPGAPTVRAGGR